MKNIYIVTDLEGVTGVFKFEQTRERGPLFERAMSQLMNEIAAVAEGLRAGGADEITVIDGHNGGNNFIPELMVAGVNYITGSGRPRPLACFDESFAGMVMLGYHAMNGTPDGILHHTQSSLAESKYWYDDIERGEIYQCAVLAGHYNVPVILVTGDEATCREAQELLGENLPTVAVKKGLGRQAGVLLAPAATRPMLVEGGRRAMAALPFLRPYKPKFPIKMRVRRKTNDPSNLDAPWYQEREGVINNGLELFS